MQYFFNYGDQEIAYLSKKDKRMAMAIEVIGKINRPVIPDLFTALVFNIIGQQISTKAQQTICNRMIDQYGEINPTRLLVPTAEIQKLGITWKKAAYIRDIAQRVECGEIDLMQLYALPDQLVVNQLSKLPGIGKWTAEMILLFSMQRQDILSYQDLAIMRGLRMLYSHKEISRERFERYRRRYSPFGSIASLYLWEIASYRYDAYKDPLQKQKNET